MSMVVVVGGWVGVVPRRVSASTERGSLLSGEESARAQHVYIARE